VQPDGALARHYFTVDVEEHFQVLALAPWMPRQAWDGQPSRVAANTGRLLDLLDAQGARGTFFTLGWVAERQPALIRAIAARGHEVASHGWDHRRVTELTPAEFRDQARRSKQILEDLSGQSCLGYRAPNYSIVKGREWALEILLDEGYRYDSSLFPIARPGYGYAGAARDPWVFHTPSGPILEFPPATLRRAALNLPASGGAYFRLFPYALVATALRDCERRGVPGVFYIHPWELDPGQPRVAVPLLTRVRHYGNLGLVAGRIERLLAEFRFGAIAHDLARWTDARDTAATAS
jgi:polysaccharide deacetylase family protein (PEP-CTERM system associated)